MRNKERTRLDALREVQNLILYADKETGTPATDAKILSILAGHRAEAESARQELMAHGKSVLAADEEAVVQVIDLFVPTAMTPEQVLASARGIMKDLGLSNPKEMGRLIKAMQEKLGGAASNKAIGEAAKTALSESK